MSPRRDPYFGRFAFMVATVGFVTIVLGLGAIWYVFQTGGIVGSVAPLRELTRRGGSLPPSQVLIYLTKDGKQLVSNVAEVGEAGMSSENKARVIVTKLIEGKDAALLRSPIPQGTKLKSVFINGKIIIVNLSSEFMNNLPAGIDSELLAVYSIVDSLLYNIDSAEAVQILIDGEKVLTVGGHLDISTPLIANTAITRAS